MNVCIENKGYVPRRRENPNKIGYICVYMFPKRTSHRKLFFFGGVGEWNAECRMDTASFVKYFISKKICKHSVSMKCVI